MFGASLAIAVEVEHDDSEMHPEHEGVVPVGLQALVASPAAANGDGDSRLQSPSSAIGSVHIVMPPVDQPNQVVMREGFLHKIGGNVKNWKTRYFRLLPGRLNYYKDGEDAATRLGSILLPQATLSVFAADVFQGHPFCFGITPADSDRQYILDCDSVAHRSAWMSALQAPIRQRIKAARDSVRESFLVKQGSTVRNWKKRYCVLTTTALRYFEAFDNLHDCLGTVPLGGGFIVGCDDSGSSSSASSAVAPSSPASGATAANNPFGFSLRSHGSERTYYFLTSTRAERDGWVQALQQIQKQVGI